jgi:hypothetical protein
MMDFAPPNYSVLVCDTGDITKWEKEMAKGHCLAHARLAAENLARQTLNLHPRTPVDPQLVRLTFCLVVGSPAVAEVIYQGKLKFNEAIGLQEQKIATRGAVYGMMNRKGPEYGHGDRT